jgi:hypothetical protein
MVLEGKKGERKVGPILDVSRFLAAQREAARGACDSAQRLSTRHQPASVSQNHPSIHLWGPLLAFSVFTHFPALCPWLLSAACLRIALASLQRRPPA